MVGRASWPSRRTRTTMASADARSQQRRSMDLTPPAVARGLPQHRPVAPSPQCSVFPLPRPLSRVGAHPRARVWQCTVWGATLMRAVGRGCCGAALSPLTPHPPLELSQPWRACAAATSVLLPVGRAADVHRTVQNRLCEVALTACVGRDGHLMCHERPLGGRADVWIYRCESLASMPRACARV